MIHPTLIIDRYRNCFPIDILNLIIALFQHVGNEITATLELRLQSA